LPPNRPQSPNRPANLDREAPSYGPPTVSSTDTRQYRCTNRRAVRRPPARTAEADRA